MPKFYMIIAGKVFYPFFWVGGSRAPHYAPPVSYTYASSMLIVNFTNIIIVSLCIVGIAHELSIGYVPDDTVPLLNYFQIQKHFSQ